MVKKSNISFVGKLKTDLRRREMRYLMTVNTFAHETNAARI